MWRLYQMEDECISSPSQTMFRAVSMVSGWTDFSETARGAAFSCHFH